MRITAIIAILGLSACSVTNNTARNSGAGITNAGVPVQGATQTAGETDYRGQLFEDLNGS